MGKLEYLVSSAVRTASSERQKCTNCGASGAPVTRKYVVTVLRRCTNCKLQYRTPTDTPAEASDFYNEDYEQGDTTNTPALDDLEAGKAKRFDGAGSDYDYGSKVLSEFGVPAGGRVFDFGCSWGYGSWLLAQDGFSVKSFELARGRANFGAEHLGVDLAGNFEEFVAENAGTFDAFLSMHVLEHVPAPSHIFNEAKKLVKPGGLITSFFPNGSADYRKANPSSWNSFWGMVHPNFMDEVYLADHFGDVPHLIGVSPGKFSAEDKAHLEKGKGPRILGPLNRPELFVVARNV